MDPDETARMRRLIWIHAGRKRTSETARNISCEMNISKGNRKKNVRPKNEVLISPPFDFRHDIHVGHENYVERLVDGQPISPPAPCAGCKDSFGDISIPGEAIALLKEEIIPALLLEIGDIVESRIKSLLHDQTKEPTTPHCQTCSCFDRATSIATEPENSDIKEVESGQFGMPKPSHTVIVDDTNFLENVTGMKMITIRNIQDSGDKRQITKSISNPVYHQKEQTLLIQTKQGTKLVKYGSDIQLKRAESSTKVLARSNTLPGLTKNGQSPGLERREIQSNHRGRPLSKFDQRVCMAHALQWHIEDLVDGIVFKDSELPDSLLEDGCLTEEECSGVRQKLDRRDQVRVLVRVIKGRDFDILERFLRHIGSHNEIVAKRIMEKFEQNLKKGMRCSKCALCKLTTQVNLKYIVDSLWRHSLIEDGLFNVIVDTDKPTGDQGEIWHRLIQSLNSHNPSDVRNVLVKALTVKQHYHHIAQGVEWMINANGELKCRCEIQKNMIPAGSMTSLVSSRSPPTSESEMVADSHSDISRISNETENATIIEPAREVIRKTTGKVRSPVRNVSHDNIITEQPDQSRSNIETIQSSELDSTKQDNSVKFKPPVPPRKRHGVLSNDETQRELETSKL